MFEIIIIKTMKHILTIILIFITLNCMSFGFADWQHKTPGGNIMRNYGSGIYLELYKTNVEIENIDEWYFYRNFIVGKTSNEYFIIKETNCEIFKFKDKGDWDNLLELNKLKPIMWTRWYSGNWIDLDNIIIWSFFLFFISIPLIIFFVFALYKSIFKEKLRIKKTYTILVLVTILVSVIGIVIDYNPQSF